MVVVGIAVWLSAPEMMMRKAPQQAASVSEASRPNAPRAPSSEPEMELRAGRQQEPGPAEIDRAAQSTQSVATLAERGKKPQTVQDEKNSRGTLYDITPSRKREEYGYTASGAMMGGAVAKTSDLPRPDQKADVQEKIALAPSAPSSVARPRNEPTRESAEETPNGQAVSTADTRLMAANRIVTEQPPAKVESKDKESSDTLKQAQKRNEPAAVAELSMAQGSKRLMKSKPPTTFGFFPAVRLSGDGMLQQQELGRNDRWRDLKIGSGEPLRALALRGNEIWVGGDKGVLYRSADGGKTWTAVDLQLPDQVGVVALKFRDLMHGELTTTTGERWISEDGGVSWKNAAEEK
jgi:hypothetical protein